MGGTDIADQLRGSYRFDHWLKCYKWWHSIFWWGVQILMVNSYKCYRRYHEIDGLELMTHYEYQTNIACAWLDKSYFDEDKKEISISRSVCSMTSLNTCNSGDTNRRPRIYDPSINPFTGSLKHRLNHALPHWCTTITSVQSYCQLHYWATGTRKCNNVVLHVMLLFVWMDAMNDFIRTGIWRGIKQQ